MALGEEPALACLLDADRLRELTDPACYLGWAAVHTERALRRGARCEHPVPGENR